MFVKAIQMYVFYVDGLQKPISETKAKRSLYFKKIPLGLNQQ
jgi:hypothetical protein